MVTFLAVTLVFAALLGSSCSEARPSYQRYGSPRRGTGGNPESRRLSQLEDMVAMLKEDVQELKEAEDLPLAAFTAFLGPRTAVVPADDPIVFPLEADYGEVYSTTTGIFTAPVDGIYSIGVSIRPFDIDPASEFGSVTIVRSCPDGSTLQIGRVTSSNEELPFDVSSSNIVFYFEAGCEVFIRSDVTASFSDGSVFTGFLVEQVTLEE